MTLKFHFSYLLICFLLLWDCLISRNTSFLWKILNLAYTVNIEKRLCKNFFLGLKHDILCNNLFYYYTRFFIFYFQFNHLFYSIHSNFIIRNYDFKLFSYQQFFLALFEKSLNFLRLTVLWKCFYCFSHQDLRLLYSRIFPSYYFFRTKWLKILTQWSWILAMIAVLFHLMCLLQNVLNIYDCQTVWMFLSSEDEICNAVTQIVITCTCTNTYLITKYCFLKNRYNCY